MKGCQVYKTDKHYKIVTVYRQESWAYMSSRPIYILSIKVEEEEFADKLFKALRTSRDIKESEEDDFWLGKELLKELKESSFDKFYKKSTSCSVWLNKKGMLGKKEIEIVPNSYGSKSTGLVSMDEETIKMEYKKGLEAEIAKQVMNILNGLN